MITGWKRTTNEMHGDEICCWMDAHKPSLVVRLPGDCAPRKSEEEKDFQHLSRDPQGAVPSPAGRVAGGLVCWVTSQQFVATQTAIEWPY